MSLYTSIHTEYTTLVMNPNVNFELRVLKTHQRNIPLCLRMLIMVEEMHVMG